MIGRIQSHGKLLVQFAWVMSWALLLFSMAATQECAAYQAKPDEKPAAPPSPADPLVKALALTQQVGLLFPIFCRQRPCRPPDGLIEHPACQPLLPADPGFTTPPGTDQRKSKIGQRRGVRCKG